MSFSLANIDTLYAEDPQLRKNDVVELVQWLKTQPQLPELTELQVILFLHSCYYQIEATKTTILNYFTLKTNSKIFQAAGEEKVKNTLSNVLTLISPKRTPAGESIFIFKFLNPKSEGYVCVDHFKLIFMVTILDYHQKGPSNGFILVCDMGNASFGYLVKLSISAIRQMFYFLQVRIYYKEIAKTEHFQEAAPIRLKSLQFINVAPVTQHMLALAKPFIKKEIYNGIKFHTESIETLYDHVPKECLPEEHGGELPSFLRLNEENIQNVVNHLDFFEWHDSQKMDESKQPGKGFFGFFKKTEVE